MEYYNPLKRRLFFWTLTLLYIIIIPIIIGYVFGYRYSPKRGVFIFGGSITIKSTPSDISVRVNGQSAPQGKFNYLNSSYHIGSLYPGDYSIEVQKDGYAPWSKRVPVHSGVSTEFWNVLLTRDNPDAKEFPTGNIRQFFLSPKQNTIAYTFDNNGEFLVDTLNIETGLDTQVFSSFQYHYPHNTRENIEWSPRNDAILIPLQKNGTDDSQSTSTDVRYFIVSLETNLAVSLRELLPEREVHSARWSPSERDVIYFLSSESLFKMNIGDNPSTTEISNDVAGYDIGSGGIYIIQKSNGMVFRKNLTGETTEQLTTSPLVENAGTHQVRIVAYDETRLAAIASNGVLTFFNKGEKKTEVRMLSTNTSDVQFSNDGKKILYWNDHEIFVYFTRDWDVQPQRNEGDILEVGRFFNTVANVHWAKSYEHVIYTTQDAIQIIELDRRDQQNVMTLVKLNNSAQTKAFSDVGGSKFYFTDAKPQSDQWRLNVIDFPEKTNFFGL